MTKTAQELTRDTLNDFRILAERLEQAKKNRDEFNRQLRNAKERLSRRENTKYPEIFAENFVKSLRKGNVLEQLLIRAIDRAAEVNGEFREDFYKKALYEVAKDSRIFKIIIIGNGWSTRPIVSIVFEETAGTLSEWGTAVENYRNEIKTRGLNNEESGEKASRWWYQNVFGSGLEKKTFLGRMSYVSRKAPFWQLLAYGTVGLSSDRPGGYTDVVSTRTSDTVFVENVEWEIRNTFDRALRTEREKFLSEEEELKNLIKEYEQKRDEYSAEVSSLKTDIRLNERIYRSFEEKAQFIDRDLLAKAIRSVGDSRLKRVETINLATQGSGLQLLITVRRTEGLIEY